MEDCLQTSSRTIRSSERQPTDESEQLHLPLDAKPGDVPALQGINLQATYSFQRGIASNNAGGTTTWLNVLDRGLDRASRGPATSMTSGSTAPSNYPSDQTSCSLPTVPEWWRGWLKSGNVGVILNLLSGSPLDITGQIHTLEEAIRMLSDRWTRLRHGHATMTSGLPTWYPAGTFTFPMTPNAPMSRQHSDSRLIVYQQCTGGCGRQLLVVNSQPGKLGNLGPGVIYGPGNIGFNLSASKTVRVSESKSFQVRVDAANVLNHPLMG
jgi:hypothetical protein